MKQTLGGCLKSSIARCINMMSAAAINMRSVKTINKRSVAVFIAVLSFSAVQAQKQLFIPDSLKPYDLNDPESRWCMKHSTETKDVIFFWEKGFGDDPACPPDLEGHKMSFDLNNLKNRVQGFYDYFRDTLQFLTPGSKAEKYKMMVMVNYSLEGTAYGGTYDDFIGALWVAPNRIQDQRLNCMAHELGHSFQLQIPADKAGDAWGGSGFFEMTSQWMLWRVNPKWIDDETYHFDAFKNLTHRAFLSISNIYHSPYVIEWWAEKHGLPSIAELYRQGRIGEDPAMTYMRVNKLSQKQFNDEMFDCYCHLVNFDFQHARQETRKYAATFSTPLDTLQGGWMRVKADRTLEDYGFNAIEVPLNTKKAVVEGKNIICALVGIANNDECIYGKAEKDKAGKGKATIKTPRNTTLKKMYLVVMGAPESHVMLNYEDESTNRKYPYKFKLY